MARFSRTSASPPALPSGAAKLLVLIIAAGVIAASLLVTRQQRIETAHELTTLDRRMKTNERALWEMRAAIAERCRPEAVRRMLETRPAAWTAIPRRGRATTEPASGGPPAGASAALAPVPPDMSPGRNPDPSAGRRSDPEEPEPGG